MDSRGNPRSRELGISQCRVAEGAEKPKARQSGCHGERDSMDMADIEVLHHVPSYLQESWG